MFQRASLCEISIWSNNGATTPGIPRIPYAAQKTRMVQSYNRGSLEGERTMPFQKHAMQRAKANGERSTSTQQLHPPKRLVSKEKSNVVLDPEEW
jgi:hypothetical protein